MQDAVAEVLQERSHLDQSISTGLLYSILLHALLFVPLLLNVAHARKPPADPVRVRLAGPSPSEIQKPAASPAAPAQKPIETAQKPPQTPAPEVQPDIPKPATKQVEKSLFGQSPEKPVDKKADDRNRAAPAKQPPQEAIPTTPSQPSETPAGQAGSQGQSAGIAVGGGSAQISGLEGDFPYTFYVERMLGIIGGNWFRPDVGSIGGGTIHFVIERNGRIRDVEITQSSGNSSFDRAARRAVIESSPLPPLPLQYSGSELGVHLKFN